MTTEIIVKRFFVLIGVSCIAWMVISFLTFTVMGLASMVQTTAKDTGEDTLVKTAKALIDLPFWGIIAIALLSIYAVIYIRLNKETLKKDLGLFFENFFQE